jgi:hypothetical protein
MSEALPLAGGVFCPAVAGISIVPIDENGDLVLGDVSSDLHAVVLESFYQTYPSKKPSGGKVSRSDKA